MKRKPDTASVLAELKDFQRSTVDYVFDRFYGKDPTRRFLVADEVGLGKTLVARGIIARTIDHLWESKGRLTVVYICSNKDIASQNIKRLSIPGCHFSERSTRLTLLPLELQDLGKHPVDVIALTPGTSFDQRGGGGEIRERALLYWLLNKAWRIHGSRKALNVLTNYAGVDSFKRTVDNIDRSKINKAIIRSFTEALKLRIAQEKAKGEPDLKKRFNTLCKAFHRKNARTTDDDWRARSRWIGEMRHLLARVCLESFSPDLIILDEFQRFSHLLDESSEAGELARVLFDAGDGGTGTRLLLLSATPYKSLRMHHEKADGESNGFVTLVKALEDDPESDFHTLLDDYRASLPTIRDPQGLAAMRSIRDRIEKRLRKIIVRTEKSTGSGAGSSMLAEPSPPRMDLKTTDVQAFLGTQRIAEHVGAGDVIEYWKSAPYLFNFMEGYALKKVFDGRTRDARLARLTDKRNGTFLDFEDIDAYRRIEPTNARLRSLEEETVGRGMWKLLWLPPSLGYYQPGGPYADHQLSDVTKRLVFSSWHVVPRAVASLVSYEAERRMMNGSSRSGKSRTERWAKQRALLRFEEKSRRLSGLPVFNLVYPCITFAEKLDPRELAVGKTARGALTIIGKQIRKMATALKLPSSRDGKADERWYWMLPMLLDAANYTEESETWWSSDRLDSEWSGTDQEVTIGWARHLEVAQRTLENVKEGKMILGPKPKNLFKVLACVASAAPATAALRALWRSSGRSTIDCFAIRLAAAKVGWSFLSLFNHPEVTSLIRSEIKSGAYWRRVLAYAHDGQLQAVLDEYVHVLSSSFAASSCSEPSVIEEITGQIIDSVSLRSAPLSADQIETTSNGRKIEISNVSMRLRFAMRFGEEKERHDPGDGIGNNPRTSRKERVRAAFNSPFWPFVLVSTSVGQEGLDFHHYCHAITHWNLPANPVDLEQREGRIHRYKGHAIRKNVAARYGTKALKSGDHDTWATAFDLAISKRDKNENDLVPFWHFPGESKIERHVPALPFSKDARRIEALREALAIYRLVLGQSRQEDLIDYLLAEVPKDERHRIVSELQINLGPILR